METIRRSLANICDIDKLLRQLVLHKVYPQSIYSLYRSLLEIEQLSITVGKNTKIRNYLIQDPLFSSKLRTCIEFIETILDIEACANVASVQHFEQNIIRGGISTSLDRVQTEYVENLALFHKTHRYFNDLMKETDFVKIHETEKLGFTLQITRKRGEQLQTILSKISTKNEDGVKVLTIDPDRFVIPVKDVRMKKTTSTNDEIEFPQLTRLQDTIRQMKDQINGEIAAAYLEFLHLLEKKEYESLRLFSTFVADLDLLQCKAYVARKFNYCRPEIVEHTTSFFDCKDLRHALIEHIQTSELYVTNDLHLDRGLLIYGTNAVGKTSFIRSIGICIVLAQAGFYVPCSQFRYKPYTAIYSRILGNDNLFKGLSTFAVEMSELRVILKHADERSLILGDELCSGTEIESALSIFAAGLVALHEKAATFLFATHFHEIANYEEIQALPHLAMKHMAVKYDKERDCLLYERKLVDGPGNRMYGLEVCKSLHLEQEFLESAFQFRRKYFDGLESDLMNPVSKYNGKKIRGMCEICKGTMGQEIHHLSPQKDADLNGFIGSFHKNHPANLASVCEKCHRELHSIH